MPAALLERLLIHPAERREAILSVIGNARQQLIFSVFRCDDFPILDALASAIRRKVRVRALITKKAKDWGKRLRELEVLLQTMGAEVCRYGGEQRKYHAKYMVADGGPALVTSLNFTRKCFERTCDFVLVTHDASVVAGLTRLFEADCSSPDAPLPRTINGDLIAGPDFARPRLVNLLLGARRSIRIIDHRVTDPEFVSLLKWRQAQGISVQVLGRHALDGLDSHGKMILVDGTLAAIGSVSLSPPSLNLRREVAVMVRDSASIERLRDFFDLHACNAPVQWIADADSGEDDESD
ncbi:MAG: phospholipase D-like domain-containing protein [Candidatus Solibacter sp.]